jgi:uncharacterized protein
MHGLPALGQALSSGVRAMNSDVRSIGCILGLLLAAAGAQAQTADAANNPAAGTPAPVIGSGPGFHDPRSPFKPLEDKAGVVPWATLAAVTTRTEKNQVLPVFPQQVQAMNNQKVKVQGFMMPLEPGEKQKHFLLSAVPATCSFCVPAGPEGLIEVRSLTPVKYSLEPVLMEGKLAVLTSDPYGLFYRITEAQPAQ